MKRSRERNEIEERKESSLGLLGKDWDRLSF